MPWPREVHSLLTPHVAQRMPPVVAGVRLTSAPLGTTTLSRPADDAVPSTVSPCPETVALPDRPPRRADGESGEVTPFRVLVISLGGERAAQQTAQFSAPELLQPDHGRPIEMGFVPGVRLDSSDGARSELASLLAVAVRLHLWSALLPSSG